MYNIQVHVPYEKQQYIKKMNHYITTYPYITTLHQRYGTLKEQGSHADFVVVFWFLSPAK